MKRTRSAALHFALLPVLMLLPFPLAAQSSDTGKPKTNGSAGKVVAGVNADVTAARQAEAEKRYADAEALMQKDVSEHPELAVPRVELGLAQLSLEKYDAAAANFRQVLGINTSIDAVTPADSFYQSANPQTTHASRNTAGGEYIA